MRRILSALDQLGRVQTGWALLPLPAQIAIAAMVTAGLAAILGFVRSAPWDVLFVSVLAAGILGAFLPLALREWAQYFSTRRGLPLSVETNGYSVTEPQGEAQLRTIALRVHLLNHSADRCMSLAFERVHIRQRPPHASANVLSPNIAGLETNLGPEEDSAGTISFCISDEHYQGHEFMALWIRDRLSGKRSIVEFSRDRSAITR